MVRAGAGLRRSLEGQVGSFRIPYAFLFQGDDGEIGPRGLPGESVSV